VEAGRDTVTLGYLAIGIALTAAQIQKEAATAGTEVTLLVGDSLASATFPDSVRPALRDFLRRGGNVQKPTFHGQTYLWSSYRIPAGGTPTTIVLFRRVTDELTIANGIKQSLFGIGFAALVLALVLAFVVARIVARPAQALAEASQRLARGDYAAPLPRDSGDEIGQLARAFGEMRAAIAEREQRLRSAQAEMIHREKLAAMGRLVAQLSHEINNPIYNIQNCLEALERRGDPNDPNREFLTLAQEELSRLAALTRRLLDQSRAQSVGSSLVKVMALVRRVLALAGAPVRARRLRPCARAMCPRYRNRPDLRAAASRGVADSRIVERWRRPRGCPPAPSSPYRESRECLPAGPTLVRLRSKRGCRLRRSRMRAPTRAPARASHCLPASPTGLRLRRTARRNLATRCPPSPSTTFLRCS
jgi:signal transduction histidine kinase